MLIVILFKFPETLIYKGCAVTKACKTKFLFNFRGKFAVVKKCIQKDTEKEFAAKFMRKRRKGQDCRMEIIHEIAVLELAQCNLWVINLHEVYETATEMILVLE